MYYFFKRIIDIIISSIGLIFFIILLIPLSIIVKLDSKGPVFADSQLRVGKDGRTFRMYKLRSMIPNADSVLKNDPKLKEFYEYKKKNIGEKIPNDPRITKAGRVLRKYSIDEFPQLLNVFKGDMSIVGPRPYYMHELNNYRSMNKTKEVRKLIREALSIKPGITGVWQISGRSDISFDKRLQLDAKYASKKSLLKDIVILLKTPKVILFGRGAR